MKKLGSKKIKVLDLFSGVGGMSYGFEMAGFDIIAAVEFDKVIAESMSKNHKKTKMYIGDIRDIKPETVKKEVGKIDIIIGGPPCQGFSLKGQRKGLDDERNFLFKEYIKYVKFFKPSYFVIENVPMILSTNNGYFKDEILKEFTSMGYCVDYGVLDTSEFGVPQKRKRAVFIGTLKKNKIFLPKNKVEKVITTWDAISDLAYLNSGEGDFKSNYKKTPQTQYQIKMRKNSKTLYNHSSTNHSIVALDRLSRIPPEKGKEYLTEKISSTFGQTWGRLEKNKPSPTIVTRFDTPSNGKNSHPFLNRAITPREAARIQSFPDSFIFYGNKSSVIKQIGNAVPPLLGKVIAEQILEHIKKND